MPLVRADNELITSRGTFALAQHRLTRSSVGGSAKRQTLTRIPERPAEVTDIIPFNEFGDLADLDFYENSAFDREAQINRAPELDDLHDTDDQLPLQLAVPSEFRRAARDERRSSHAYRDSHTDVSDGLAATISRPLTGTSCLRCAPRRPAMAKTSVAAAPSLTSVWLSR